jgi:hypothetical protein
VYPEEREESEMNDYEKGALQLQDAIDATETCDLIDPDLEARLYKIRDELELLKTDTEARA